MSDQPPRNVVIFGPEDVHALEIASVMDTFNEANAEASATLYAMTFVSERRDTIRCASGLRIVPDQSILEPVPEIDTLLVAGSYGVPGEPSDAVITWLRERCALARRFGSVCTGTFLLGAAGLIDGREVTTHWYYADALRSRIPAARVDADRIFIREGPLFTSAGVSACIDLALSLIEEDHGRDLAVSVARHLVMYLKRPGGQSQYSVPLAAQARTQSPIARLQAWIIDYPDQDLSVAALASRVAMSPRNFTRVFRSETGLSPATFVEQVRIDKARRMLELTSLPLDQVARLSGLGTAGSARRIFLRRLGISLRQYRDRFKLGNTAASD
ncbi:GlxA family transcriptional regulator [Novosphingobium sp. 9U]|uniref:GlxA family transcriptional regulator n=1 Tax=Novosphingobium sp. 9U TaxID=2653158 RepID=UPI0012F13F1D|nr:DJ-1/PfpI family protein [Novosphingobium sp. 9U]VWX51150.1 AraC family transcriptional regulator [Novosphingobium sp. 9U]